MTLYNDYSRDKVGMFFGLTAAQLATLVVGAMPALLALSGSRWLLTAVLVVGWIVLALLTVMPIHGRSAVGWTAAGLRFLTGRVTVVPPESWRAFLCGCPVGRRAVLVVDGAHHANRAVSARVVVEPVAPVQHNGLGLASGVELVA